MRTILRAAAAALSLLLLLIPLVGGTVAADQSYTINGVTVRYRDFSSSHNNCWGYTYNFYYKIWGVSMNSNFYGSDNILRGLSNEELRLTPENLKKYVSEAVPGAALRVCDSGYLHGSDGMGHSLLIVSIQEDGFTTFEGGLLAAPYSREHFYTWEEFCQTSWLGGRYDYIKYIKWPAEPTEEEQTDPSDGESEKPTLGMLEIPEPPVSAGKQEYALGDLDGNGTVDSTDYALLKRTVGGMVRLTDAQKRRADLDGNGKIDLKDAALLKKHIARMNNLSVSTEALFSF